MAKMLDFTKTRKPTLPIKLSDDLMVHVYTPSKALLEEMIDAQDQIGNMANDMESVDQFYDLVARLMSNNKTGRKLTGEEISDLLNVDDLIVFFYAYTEFISEQTNSKN